MSRTDRLLFGACIALIIIWGLVVGSYVAFDVHRGLDVYTRNVIYRLVPGSVTIDYVAVNQTSQEIYLKFCNNGLNGATLTELRVNGTYINTGNSLPLAFQPMLDYKTFVFHYNGSMQGSILITFNQGDYFGPVQKLVDLKAASSNPISGAYTSEMDTLNMLSARGDIFAWSELTFFLGLVIVVPLLIMKSWRPILHFPTPLGGAIVAFSFILSIIAAIVILLFPYPFRLPVTIAATLPVLVPYVAGPALIVGSALVVIVLKYLAEYYRDHRMYYYAVVGFICVIICVATAAMTTFRAYDLGSSFGTDEPIHVAPLAPILPPLVMNLQGGDVLFSTLVYDLFAGGTLWLLFISALFFALSFNRLSKKTGTARLKTVTSQLIRGTVLVIIFSAGITVLISVWNSRTIDASGLLTIDYIYTAVVLGGVALLSIGWISLTRILYSIQAAHATHPRAL